MRRAWLVAVVALAGCGGHPAAAPSTPDVPGAVGVHRSVRDPVDGTVVTVQQVARSGDHLLIEVQVTAGTRFGDPVEPGELTVVGAGTTTDGTAPAGLPALATAGPGASATGWLAYAITGPGLSLRYTQPAIAVPGSQLLVPSAAYEVGLPDPT